MPDRLRVVSNTGQNLRINVDTGAANVDGPLGFAPGDPRAGTTPNIVGAAYSNNFAGATSTTLFDIDTRADILAIQNPPNDGTLNSVGGLGVKTSNLVGFDISGVTGTGYAAFESGSSQLYTINLGNGAATLVGTIGGGATVTGLSAAAAPIPEPASLALLGSGLAGLGWFKRRRKPVE